MKISEKEIPEKIKRRIGLSKMYCPLERKDKRKWGKIFDSTFDEIYSELEKLAKVRDYIQNKLDNNKIMWKDKNDKTAECMFCIINDITNVDLIQDVFNIIKKYKPVFTYAVVHQKKDGDGVFDIFRFSKFSYLEHCNRVISTKKKGIHIHDKDG